MKFYDVTNKREYEKNGIKKNVWLKVGTYKETEDGKKFLELNMFPTTPFYIFEQKPKEVPTTTGSQAQAVTDIKWEE